MTVLSPYYHRIITVRAARTRALITVVTAGQAWLFFVVFMFLSRFVLVNAITAIVLDGFAALIQQAITGGLGLGLEV